MPHPGNIRLTGTITIPVAQQARFCPLLEAHADLTNEEPGCLKFKVTQDADHPETFNVSELFVDADAFTHHQKRGANSAWGRESGELVRNFNKETL